MHDSDHLELGGSERMQAVPHHEAMNQRDSAASQRRVVVMSSGVAGAQPCFMGRPRARTGEILRRAAAGATCLALVAIAAFGVVSSGSGARTSQAVLLGRQTSGAERLLVQIPPGVAGGELFQAEAPGYGEFKVRAPLGALVGQKIFVSLSAPKQVDSQELAFQRVQQLVQKQQVEQPRKVFSTQIPAGVMAGQSFKVQVPGGGQLLLTVPYGKGPGQMMEFERPAPAPKIAHQHKHSSVESEELEFQVPVGAKAGEDIVIKDKTGKQFKVQVPAGAKQGELLKVHVGQRDALATLQGHRKLRTTQRQMRLQEQPKSILKSEEQAIARAVTKAVSSALTKAMLKNNSTSTNVTDAAEEAADDAEEDFEGEDAANVTVAGEDQASEAAKEEAVNATASEPAAAPTDEESGGEADEESGDEEDEAASEAVPEQEPVEAPAAIAPAQATPDTEPVAAVAPATAPAVEPQAQVVGEEPQEEPGMENEEAEDDDAGMGHRDAEYAWNNHEPIAETQIPENFQGEAMPKPEFSTNKYTVTVYGPVPASGRRNRGVATVWNHENQAWEFDKSKERPIDLSWIDKPGVWEEIDSWMGHPKPDKKYLVDGVSAEDSEV